MASFDAEVRASGRGSHALVVPKPVVTELGTRRVLVRIGPESFEATLGAYGGRTFLSLRKSHLVALGAVAGDTLHVELDPAPPAAEPEAEAVATTCPELEDTLAGDAPFREVWQALPEGHQTEYGRWISVGEDPDTRQTRIARLHHRLLPSENR